MLNHLKLNLHISHKSGIKLIKLIILNKNINITRLLCLSFIKTQCIGHNALDDLLRDNDKIDIRIIIIFEDMKTFI